MDVNELVLKTLNILGEKERDLKGYDGYILETINQQLADYFDLNNIVRRKNGKEPIGSIEVITEFTDVIPYEDEVVRKVLTYALAAWLLVIDEEYDKANWYIGKAAENAVGVNAGRYVRIKDVIS